MLCLMIYIVGSGFYTNKTYQSKMSNQIKMYYKVIWCSNLNHIQDGYKLLDSSLKLYIVHPLQTNVRMISIDCWVYSKGLDLSRRPC